MGLGKANFLESEISFRKYHFCGRSQSRKKILKNLNLRHQARDSKDLKKAIENKMVPNPDAIGENTPLLVDTGSTAGNGENNYVNQPSASRQNLFDFLEAKTPAGRKYETVIIGLIAVNVLAFILGSLFLEEYNDASWAKRDTGICQNLCDSLFFGNYADNGLEGLHLGTTSVLEIVTVAIFSVEYILRLHTCDLEDPKYKGASGRFRYIFTFFSIVDLASTLPFFVDALLVDRDVAGSAFLRMFRLLRMMRVEGRYDTALSSKLLCCALLLLLQHYVS